MKQNLQEKENQFFWETNSMKKKNTKQKNNSLNKKKLKKNFVLFAKVKEALFVGWSN